MNPTRINFANFSKAFWEQVEYSTRDEVDASSSSILDTCRFCEQYREKADYKTGSINFAAMLRLYALMSYYQPRVIIEIGTFIGRSTSMFSLSGKVYTCDKDNDAFPASDYVKTFPKTNSTDMLKQLTEPADFFFFDGRIADDDISHILRLSKPDTVYAFDDFVGVEKGVVNVIKLTKVFKSHILIDPQDGIALMVSPATITLTRQ